MSDRIEGADLAPELRIAQDYQKRIDDLLARIEELAQELKDSEDSNALCRREFVNLAAVTGEREKRLLARIEALTKAGDGLVRWLHPCETPGCEGEPCPSAAAWEKEKGESRE